MDNFANTFVIFGGTGDLTHRKLLPALYNLLSENVLPTHFAIVAVGRRAYTNEMYRKEAMESIKAFGRFKLNQELFNQLEKRIYYKQLDFNNKEGYKDLKKILIELSQVHQTSNRIIYYLAVAPDYFGVIVNHLKEQDMVKNNQVVIEKPFGKDLDSAKSLNRQIVSAFSEENIYRIDHYLGKEMLQNIMVIRFANILYEVLWNKDYIDHVQISSLETLGIETRGDYYEKTGAIRDMVQSHLLQLLSLIAMDRPKELSPEAIRDEKVKVLKALKHYNEHEIKHYVIRGQYDNYRSEENVSPASTTETYVAMKLLINNERFKNVPFYLRTGKKLKEKVIEIIIQFKQPSHSLYQDTIPNTLRIKIQPQEGITFQFNAKEPGARTKIIPVKMDFCQNCMIGINSPEAYERLLYDVMKRDNTLFTRWDEVEAAWNFIDSIIYVWQKEEVHFPNYTEGSTGPIEADILLEKDHKKWFNGDEDENI